MIVARMQQPSHLLFNVHETLEEFRSRQRAAYHAGKLAWREGLINAQALQLYNELVQCVGANQFAWVKEETLAEVLDRSVSTIKRWIRQLVSAGLIRRGRRFGTSSLTYIIAYNQSSEADEHLDTTAGPAGDHSSLHEPHPQGHDQHGSQAASVLPLPALADLGSSIQASDTPPATPFGWSTNEPSFGSFSHRQTFKDQHVNSFGGGGNQTAQTRDERIDGTEASSRLQAEGVADPDVLAELQKCPMREIDCVIRYVARCRERDDPRRPGLIVHLLRRGFGRRLHTFLEAGPREIRCNHITSAKHASGWAGDDPRRYLGQGFCSHGMFGNCPSCTKLAPSQDGFDDPACFSFSDGACKPMNAETGGL